MLAMSIFSVGGAAGPLLNYMTLILSLSYAFSGSGGAVVNLGVSCHVTNGTLWGLRCREELSRPCSPGHGLLVLILNVCEGIHAMSSVWALSDGLESLLVDVASRNKLIYYSMRRSAPWPR